MKSFAVLVLCLVVCLLRPSARGADSVVISEFMADNLDTLRDGNGEASDWIELHNAGAAAVNLAGWSLTDDPANLRQWTFPSITLQPGQFLLVFASGRGTPDAAGKLHANFQLNRDGDYLALVSPDGTSIASQFGPLFPPQHTDVSYGAAQQVSSATLLPAGPSGRLLIPTTPNAAWTGGNEPFADQSWLPVTLPIGFDSPRLPAPTNLLNVALGRPVIAEGETWSGLPKENLTDGVLTTFTHNLVQEPDFFYIVDLGSTFELENLELFNRGDGCCPERLSNYTVSIHADSGPSLGPAVWSANIRTNGSNSGVSGRDLVTPGLDPTGIFAGRWIKLQARNNGTSRYFQIAELRANAANWAQGAAVTASGPTWIGLPKENLTDGNLNTFTHNLDLVPTFAYQVQLTNLIAFRRIELFNRNDGCCAERLSQYRISLHPDNAGSPGPAVWSADLRTDGSSSGVGGVDVVTAGLDPDGTFEGQWIQIESLDIGASRYFQLAEIRAFGSAGSSGYSPAIRRNVSAEMKGVNASAWLRLAFNAANPTNFDHLTLRVGYDDGFVAYCNGVEVARRLAPAGTPAFNATATASHFAASLEEITLPSTALREGANILAFHGLNVAVDDRDFLLSAELAAQGTVNGSLGYLLTPTPGSANNSTVVAGFVEDPRFDIDRGFFEAPVEIRITSPTPGATLVYTTNASNPSLANGTKLLPLNEHSSITATVRLTTTTILRAAAFKTDLQPSQIDTHTYLFLTDVLRQPAQPPGFPTTWNGFPADYQMDQRVVTNTAYAAEMVANLRSIPTLSIVMHPPDLFGTPSGIYIFPENVGDTWERPASIELINPNGSTGFQVPCGIRIWGTGWRPHSASPKHALQLKFQSQYGPKKLRYPLFADTPVQEIDNLVLRAQGSRSWCDFRRPDIEQTQYIHDSWARDTRRDMGTTDGHATYVHLYLNGLYWGLYNPVEKTDDGFAEGYYGGDKTEYDVITRRGAPEVDAGNLVAWNTMMGIVNAGLATPEQYALIQQYLDVDDFIDYMMLHHYASNHDGPTTTIANNMRAIRRRAPGGQFRFYVWDMEYTFWYPYENHLTFDLDQCPARIFQRLRANPEFRLRFADHAQRHLLHQGALTPGPAAARWQARANEIYGAVVGESARWGDVRRPSLPYTRNAEWTTELNRLLNEYFPVRTGVLLDQYKAAGLYPALDAPTFSQQGGDVAPDFQLTLDASAGTIYFTTNGLDPRLPGGAVAPGAIPYVPATWLVTTNSPARVHVPSDNALGLSWNGSDRTFNDANWLARTNPIGFDTATVPAPVPVPLQNASADFSEPSRGANLAIDANATTTGWGLYEQQDYLPKGRGSVAVFETVTNVGFPDGTRLTFTLRHAVAGFALGKFRLSATTDDRALFADGLTNRGDITTEWLPLRPLHAAAAAGAVVTINPDHSLLLSGPNPPTNTYVITVITPQTGLTGFRIETMDDPSLPSNGPGRAANGNAVLTDFSVQAAPATLAHLLEAGFAAEMQSAMLNRNASAYVRLPFEVEDALAFQHLTLRVRYQDGFVAYLNGREVARRNAPASLTWNSTAAAIRAKGQALEFEVIDLGEGLTNLVTGANLLAFQALNASAASADFLLQAELVARTDLTLPIFDSTTVNARVWVNGEWSALNQATLTARVPLRLTELMYHPPGTETVDGDEFEFLELQNTGGTPFNLSGLRFTAGISFTFPNGTVLAPGAFGVLVRNPAQFTARYPGIPVLGVYSGRLADDGETITLSRPNNGPTILSVTYADGAPWPAAPDGFAFSLVPRNPASADDFDRGANWRASEATLGSPGAADSDPNIPAVLVNEVLSASVAPELDAVELFNPAGTSVSIGGWYLTDDRQTPKKFRLPAGQTLGASGFVRYDETHFNAPVPSTNHFAFDSAGDSVYLFSADADGQLTGYSHGFALGAAAAGVSFGRHVISTGEEHFPALTATTWEAPNAAPRVGPVVLSEIMYHPAGGGDEFVELQNITSASIPLFDPGQPTNTWKLTGLGYPFPTNLMLPAGGRLLLVAADPGMFRAKYGIAADVSVLGPYEGQLQNSGERLELQRPDAPGSNGVPFITVDEVRYNDKAPWPILADGRGPSLHRSNPSAYGDDPAHWLAAAPGPGTAFGGGVPPTITTQPAAQSVVRYQAAQLRVGASGSAPLSYQWQFQGNSLPLATNSILLLSNAQPDQAGSYQVTVFNAAGAATSQLAALTVLLPPSILVQPQSRNVTLGSSATFSVVASGTGLLTYQWRFNGNDIPGATASTYVIPSVQLSHAGSYSVVVTDNVGPTPSLSANLTPLVVPVIVQPPLPQSVAVGAPVTVSATVTGYPLPFEFEWRRVSTPLRTNTVFGTTDFFTFNAPSTVTTQQYRLVVRNLATATVVPPLAAFNIITLPDSDGDGLPDSYENANGLNSTNTADRFLDLDSDGMLNWREYTAGTDPQSPASRLQIDRVTLNNGVVALEFLAVSNRTYQVQARAELDAGTWEAIAAITATPTNRVLLVTNALSHQHRFHRLVTPAQ